MYLDLIKGYRVTIWGYNAPLKEHRENMCMGATKSSSVNNYRMVSTCTQWPCFQVSGALLSMQRCDKVMDVVSETQCHSLKMCTILWHQHQVTSYGHLYQTGPIPRNFYCQALSYLQVIWYWHNSANEVNFLHCHHRLCSVHQVTSYWHHGRVDLHPVLSKLPILAPCLMLVYTIGNQFIDTICTN